MRKALCVPQGSLSFTSQTTSASPGSGPGRISIRRPLTGSAGVKIDPSSAETVIRMFPFGSRWAWPPRATQKAC